VAPEVPPTPDVDAASEPDPASPADTQSPLDPSGAGGAPVGLWALFVLFLRAGLIFGGGLAVTAVLLQELAERRKAITRSHFLALYGLARLLPSGTTTALAVGLGQLFAGFPGTVVALLGVALPSLIPTFVLTVFYEAARGSPWLDLLPVTLLPAAVALLASAVLSLGKEVARPTLEPVFAVVAFVGALALGLNPGVLLVIGGVLGAVLLRGREDGPK
jgi:chromate transporter